MTAQVSPQGVLLFDKPLGKSSFSAVALLRRLLSVQKIGHGGTLDPLATGLLILLVGRAATRAADSFLTGDKEYLATLCLGVTTPTYDAEGEKTAVSTRIPTLEEFLDVLKEFQGEIEQRPPMFSAKQQGGQRLYDLARRGIYVERKPVCVSLQVELLRYEYPEVELRVTCSKGTYIRSLAHDIGERLSVGAYLAALRRTRSGVFSIAEAVSGSMLYDLAASPALREQLIDQLHPIPTISQGTSDATTTSQSI